MGKKVLGKQHSKTFVTLIKKKKRGTNKNSSSFIHVKLLRNARTTVKVAHYLEEDLKLAG